MKTKALLLLIFCILFFSCQEKTKSIEKKATNIIIDKNNSQINKKRIAPERDTITIEYLNKHNPYDFESQLSNGYHLEFKYFQEDKNSPIEMCLNLKKGTKTIDTLNIMGYGAPHKNLGYIGADYNEYFAFVNSFGSGNPHDFKLIEKRNGIVIKSGFIVDSFKNPELLLYAKGYDSLMLYDLKKKKDYFLEDLNQSKIIDCMVSELNQVVKIKKATAKYIFIEIENHENKIITKKYAR
ncbi:hypothetical protein [Flavobacterium anhuiense]|uniref:hypothetical protein n=1 Tax=Flavobacterium anhuiense TaxID=459526 RepID=UPI003D957F30